MNHNYHGRTKENQRIWDWNTDDFDNRVEIYSVFLKAGDFERYQPLFYEHTKEQVIEAEINLMRAVWIRNRMTVLNSKRQSRYNSIIAEELDHLYSLRGT